jgi:hypothetical protein
MISQNNIPTAAWVVILCLAGMIFLLNFSLITAWKRKKSSPEKDLLGDTPKILQRPWQKEDDDLAQLSKLAEKFKQTKKDVPENRNDK